MMYNPNFSENKASIQKVHSDNSAMIATSSAMQEIEFRLIKLAATDCIVLIIGETGTGKELADKIIHHNSLRSNRAFVAINCPSLPESLLESEFLEYHLGTFTGAYS